MDTLKHICNITLTYMLNNQLTIDKATYFTIVIGQIAIYGILLTFYQFIASYNGNQKNCTSYLEYRIPDFFVMRKIIINKVVSKKVFKDLWVLEIIYKPVVTIFGGIISEKYINLLNFIWFGFVIFYFVIFVLLLFQCVRGIILIKTLSDKKYIAMLIDDINVVYLKEFEKKTKTRNSADLLNQSIKKIREYINGVDNTEMQAGYNRLIDGIFFFLIPNKKRMK